MLQTYLPKTSMRVERNTADEINEKIRRKTQLRIKEYEHASQDAIDSRLDALEREWDIERTLETSAALLTVTGSWLGFRVNRKWFALSLTVGAFLLQHAIQGWCPPVPLFRRLGVRTYKEINDERTALRIMRGDFHPTERAVEAIAQVRGRCL